MIRIQRRLLEEGYDVQLLILGTGWQQKELENLCEENGVSNAVTFWDIKQIHINTFLIVICLYVLVTQKVFLLQQPKR